eukprot:5242917-Amphidinium_carterae.1
MLSTETFLTGRAHMMSSFYATMTVKGQVLKPSCVVIVRQERTTQTDQTFATSVMWAAIVQKRSRQLWVALLAIATMFSPQIVDFRYITRQFSKRGFG